MKIVFVGGPRDGTEHTVDKHAVTLALGRHSYADATYDNYKRSTLISASGAVMFDFVSTERHSLPPDTLLTRGLSILGLRSPTVLQVG